ncbi:Glycosyltransferase like family 2 [Candidatus Nanopelagicaceae bacterium]
MSTQRVTAILVVHDGATWLPEVVASIASQTRKADQVVAIDTGSIDSTAKLLKGARIPISTLGREVGFGAAVAHGVSQLPALITDSEEWIWILHDDCVLHPGALEALLNATVDRPSVVMAGPKLLGWHDRTHLIEQGISIASNGARWTGLEAAEYDQGQHDGIHEVLAVSTAGALIRRDVFEELGGFDNNLELFRDDVDFGWRVRVAGHSVIAVSDAIGYHAQASSNERRSVDVEGALLHRPLLLDRRNAAYVLLANSSAFSLPWLGVQLLFGAILRSIGYLFAKLPGYASDELLAIASLIIRPSELLQARRLRKKNRFISSRVVKSFIPSRSVQFRASLNRFTSLLRSKILPDASVQDSPAISDLTVDEDEDLLTPISNTSWRTIFHRPMIIAALIIAIITIGWVRHRFGDLSGGALAQSPDSTRELIKHYISSWHEVGMGSGQSSPAWVLLVGIASFFTFGNPQVLISLFFIAAPFLLLVSAHRYLKRFTENGWLAAGTSLLYAISPVAVAAVNAGRLGLLVLLISLPFLIRQLQHWVEIEKWGWRGVYRHALFIGILLLFNPSILLILVIATSALLLLDYQKSGNNVKDALFIERSLKRGALFVIPFLMAAPNSFGLLRHPTRLFIEIGLTIPGGGPNLAFLGNPGGPASLPWWSISPITAILFFSYFSTTAARKFALPGIVFLLAGTLASALVIPGSGSTLNARVFPGVFLALATLFSITSGVVMFDKISARLQQSHLNYRHISVAAVLILTIFYSATSMTWLISAGSNSPLRGGSAKVLPAYLSVEKSGKTLVLRPYSIGNDASLSYFISRGSDVSLGDADVAPENSAIISWAVEGLIDNTGVTSSSVFATYGIKYVFLKRPVIDEVVQTIDGLGGFIRTSATKAGIVWKVTAPTGKLIFTDYSGEITILENKGIKASVPEPGTVTITENFSNGWRIYQNGFKSARIQDVNGLPTFEVTGAGEITVFHDGTIRRAWISFFVIVLVTSVVLALPAGRRKREISEKVLA